jgi:hypothetical protein
LNPSQNGLGKMLTANIHELLITSSTPCVKCVLRSAVGERVGGGGFPWMNPQEVNKSIA